MARARQRIQRQQRKQRQKRMTSRCITPIRQDGIESITCSCSVDETVGTSEDGGSHQLEASHTSLLLAYLFSFLASLSFLSVLTLLRALCLSTTLALVLARVRAFVWLGQGDSKDGDDGDEQGKAAASGSVKGETADGDGDGAGEVDVVKEKSSKGEKAAPVDLGPPPKFENKEDAVAAFKELLESKCTSHKMTWAEVVPLVSNDPRWRAVKSTGEKKNLFQHLMAQKQREAIDQV
jgi:hypothetical protein